MTPRHDRFVEDRPNAPFRNQFERDIDRILYSDAFRRLKGVTQVARSGESYTYHTRLTHSLKVSQVGRRLAKYLLEYHNKDRRVNGTSVVVDGDEIFINPVVVGAAALAHDLGHPPFGHAVETELDHQISRRGIDEGFEGNPQSFRILNSVETNALYSDYPEGKGRGLNLTKAVLNATLKYPWEKGATIPRDYYPSGKYNTDDKFGFYSTEREFFDWIREDQEEYVRSPEAELMDWADDVTYAVHDVIDFYQAGLIPLHEILQETSERERFISHFNKSKPNQITDHVDPDQFLNDLTSRGLDDKLMKQKFRASRETKALVDRFRSLLISDYLDVPNTVRVRPSSEGPFNRPIIDIDEQMRSRVELLKELTFYYVIENPALMSQQHGQRRVVATIFDAFLAASDPGYDSEFGEYRKYEEKIIPLPFRNDLINSDDRRERVRLIADTITKMTEQQTIELFNRITGRSPGSLQDQIIRG